MWAYNCEKINYDSTVSDDFGYCVGFKDIIICESLELIFVE